MGPQSIREASQSSEEPGLQSGDPSEPRKVILLNRFFYPDESATSQLLTDLAFDLAGRGIQVRAIASRATQSAGLLPKAERRGPLVISRVTAAASKSRSMLGRLAEYASFYPGAFLALWRVTRRGDVIVAKTDPPLISVVAMLVARAKGAKLINWIQDLYPEVAAELDTPFMSGILGRLLAGLRNAALRSTRTNVAIGSRMAERLRDLGTPARSITVIPNWSDENTILPISAKQSASRKSWGLGPSDFVVGYSGNLGRAHEVETIVGAAMLLRDRPSVKFLFVGRGQQHQRLQQLIAQEKLTSFIFKPHQPREALADTLAAADVHWVSLRPELEGLIVPSKLYGILAAGRPVLSVCDLDGEVSRVVRDYDCGFIVSPGRSDVLASTIERLADDPSLRDDLGRAARRASETAFRKSTALAEWSRVISAALGARVMTVQRQHATSP